MPQISHLQQHIGHKVTIDGWLVNKRSSGKIAFLQVRDGSGTVQGVASRADVSDEAWSDIDRMTQESVVQLVGTVSEDSRSPSGVEIHLTDVTIGQLSEEFPITPKEHGVSFLMEHRHLWLRSSKQRAALKIRSVVSQGIRDFFAEREFVLIDSPILTPAACEGTSTLFETDYFGENAYLSLSGQLYLEPAAAAF
ncbi:MAG: OB-fold nucleic acid binding domain-containing protein, partial [Thermoanaerobaculia bacterium]